jgi:hypothetical protein
MSYGPGIAVAAPLPLSKKQSSKCKEQKDNEQKCTCGSSDHKRTTHRDCPLNKKILPLLRRIDWCHKCPNKCVKLQSRRMGKVVLVVVLVLLTVRSLSIVTEQYILFVISIISLYHTKGNVVMGASGNSHIRPYIYLYART